MADCPVVGWDVAAGAPYNSFPASGHVGISAVPPGATSFRANLVSCDTGHATGIDVSFIQATDVDSFLLPPITTVVSGDDISDAPFMSMTIDPDARYVFVSIGSTSTCVDPPFCIENISASGNLTFLGGCTAPDYCAYGSAPLNPVNVTFDVTTDVILTVAAELGWLSAPWAAILAGVELIATASLCAHPPVLCEVVTANDFEVTGTSGVPVAYGKLKDCFMAKLWDLLCQCNPAPPSSLPPLQPLPPVGTPRPVQPPGLPGPPSPGGPISCSNGDLCSSLTYVSSQLNGLASLVSNVAATIENQTSGLQTLVESLSALVALMQRQGVAFAYTKSTVHAGLSGAGEFVVSGILGLSVGFSAMPPGGSLRIADPPDYFDLGELSLGTTDGWLERVRLTHNPHLVFPISGAITKVGYSFGQDAVATITELVREP